MRRISVAYIIACAAAALAVTPGCSRHNAVGTATVPRSPANLIGQSISASAIRLSWSDESGNESGFIIYRSEAASYEEVGRVPADIFVYSDIGLRDSVTYYYYVVATNDLGSSRGSNIVAVTTPHSTAAPFAPANPVPGDAETVKSHNVVLAWDCGDPNNDPVFYDIHFGTDPNPPLLLSRIGEHSYSIFELEKNTLYYWRVIAFDQRNETTGPIWMFMTDELSNQTPDMPTAPYPEDASAQIPTNISLAWYSADADGDILYYDVYFGAGDTPPYVGSQYATTYAPQYPLEPLTIYRWQVVAHDGESETRGPVWKFTTGEGPTTLGRLRAHDPVFDIWISSDYIYAAEIEDDLFVVTIYN